MSTLSTNLQLLRKRSRVSQQNIAESIGISRGQLSSYENGFNEPNAETLVAISDHFKLGLDRLLRQDLSTLTEFQLSSILKCGDPIKFHLHLSEPTRPC